MTIKEIIEFNNVNLKNCMSSVDYSYFYDTLEQVVPYNKVNMMENKILTIGVDRAIKHGKLYIEDFFNINQEEIEEIILNKYIDFNGILYEYITNQVIYAFNNNVSDDVFDIEEYSEYLVPYTNYINTYWGNMSDEISKKIKDVFNNLPENTKSKMINDYDGLEFFLNEI